MLNYKINLSFICINVHTYIKKKKKNRLHRNVSVTLYYIYYSKTIPECISSLHHIFSTSAFFKVFYSHYNFVYQFMHTLIEIETVITD